MRRLLAALIALIAAALPAGVIEGTTVDERNEPFPHLVVSLERLTWATSASLASVELIAETTSGADGAFRFRSVADGTYRLISYANDTHPTGWQVPAFPDRGPYEVGVTNAHRLIAGRLVNASGEAIAGAEVIREYTQTISDHGPVQTIMAHDLTGASGEFRLEPVIERTEAPVEFALPNGDTFRTRIRGYDISDYAGEIEIVTAPTPQVPVELMTLPVTIAIEDEDGIGIQGATVQLRPLREDLGPFAPAARTTDDLGAAQFEMLPVGRWVVVASLGEQKTDFVEFDAAVDAAPPLIEVPLRGRGRVTGHVQSRDGSPTANVYVGAQSSPNELRRRVQHVSWQRMTRTDERGDFTLDHLLPGTYAVGVWPGDDLEVETGWNTIHATIGDEHQDVAIPQPFIAQHIHERLMTGRVLDTSGSPVGSAKVWCFSQRDGLRMTGGHFAEPGLANQPRPDTAVTASPDGSYAIPVRVNASRIIGLMASDERGRIAVLDLQQNYGQGAEEANLVAPHDLMLTDPVMILGRVTSEGVGIDSMDVEGHMVLERGSAYAMAGLSPDASLQHVIGFMPFWTAQPQSSGAFSLGPVPRGTTIAILRLGDYFHERQTPTVTVPMLGDPPPVAIEVNLNRALTLQANIHIVDQQGRPIPNATVTGSGNANGAAIIGAAGEPMTMWFNQQALSQSEPAIWAGAEATGYTMDHFEGADHTAIPDEDGHLRGWTFRIVEGQTPDVTIVMRRDD